MDTKCQFFIPEKIKVGFQEREGTYTGKLAYVIYYDKKGILRKEKSWQSWRDKKIEPIEFINEPTEGFVLNKKAGGYSTGWNHRNTYIRVYDPRDFEFEISVANLLFILSECDCSRGKGLEGKFVYAWDGSELVLLPTNSQDYKNSTEFTNLKDQKVYSKDLIEGASYLTKNQNIWIYLGRFDYHFLVDPESYGYKTQHKNGILKNMYVFWDKDHLVVTKNVSKLATLYSDIVCSNFAELVDAYYKSPVGTKVKRLLLDPCEESPRTKYNNHSGPYAATNADDTYTIFSKVYQWGKGNENELERIRIHSTYLMQDGMVKIQRENYDLYTKDPYGNHTFRFGSYHTPLIDKSHKKYIEGPFYKLWAELESGLKCPINHLVTNGAI